MTDPIRDLAARLEADKQEAADAMSPGERLLAGVAMFDINVAMMRAGIRLQQPKASDEEVERILIERLREASDARNSQ